jgi:hypothetical protein
MASILLIRNGVVCLFMFRCTSNSLALPCSCVQKSDLVPMPRCSFGMNMRCFGCLMLCLRMDPLLVLYFRSKASAFCRFIWLHRGLKVLSEIVSVE